MNAHNDSTEKSLLRKLATFPFRTLYRLFILVLFSVIILYLIGQILDGKAVLYPGIGLWLFAAYVTLPRIHRKLTKMYLPDYYIGRTRTGDGFLGDPINLAFLGSEKSIKKSMESAGWVLADDLNTKTTMKMISNTLQRKSYPNAPVSSLYLFASMQNFAYQMEVGGTTSKRHHIRFWKVPGGWYLPGGYRADWLAAATYDRKVGFSLFTFQITHKIESNIDNERSFVLESIEQNKNVKIKIINNFSSAYHDRNGGGDRIQTDGALPFVTIGK